MVPQAKKTSRKCKQIVIRTIDGVVAEIPLEECDKYGVMIMPYWAKYWCKRLDSRSRLNEADRIQMQAETDETFEEFKVDADALRAMAVKGVVQVTIPFDADDLDPARKEPSPIEFALMMPWEYLLSAATKKYRGNFPLCVVRHVDGNNTAVQAYRKAKKQTVEKKMKSAGAKDATSKTLKEKDGGVQSTGGFCFVQTAPGEFASYYDFSTERELVEGAFGELEVVDLQANPSIAELKQQMAYSPDVLHFSGIDSRLGAKLMRERIAAEEAKKAQEAAVETSQDAVTPINVALPEDGRANGAAPAGNDSAAQIPVVLPIPSTSKEGKPDSQSQSQSQSESESESDLQSQSAKCVDAKSSEVVDGLFFFNEDEAKAVDTDFRTIAEAVTAGARKPQLIGFNCRYSGARIAPYCVAQGAREAIGIQNALTDDLAERFFVRFYQYWNSSNQDSLAAFIAAWDFIKPMGQSIKGTGIILWFNTCVFKRIPKPSKDSTKQTDTKGSNPRNLIQPNLSGIQSVVAKLKAEKAEPVEGQRVASSDLDNIKDLVSVSIDTLDVITPCKLHYGESVLASLYFLFKNLTPKKGTAHSIKGIDVEVTFNIGQESYPYRTLVSLGVDHPNLELTNRNLVATADNPPGGIKVPLTSGLIQSAEDNVRGSIYVNIEWEGQILHRHTYSVNIAAVNEWRLGAKDSLLQPMFVQPRDCAVKEIVASAQSYLRCLEGSAGASFNGYQSSNIESQINAIWSTLVLDYKLGYISPPPSYNLGSQRLRTPSQVLKEGRGTCVDLALMLASCLEWIELYPVVFNMAQHAFVGCWAHASSNSSYIEVDENGEEKEVIVQCYDEFAKQYKAGAFQEVESIVDSYPWVFPADAYRTVYHLISTGAIIPLETVCITEPAMYESAKEFAIGYFGETAANGPSTELLTIGAFESVTDVRLSRQHLQPLPLPKN